MGHWFQFSKMLTTSNLDIRFKPDLILNCNEIFPPLVTSEKFSASINETQVRNECHCTRVYSVDDWDQIDSQFRKT